MSKFFIAMANLITTIYARFTFQEIKILVGMLQFKRKEKSKETDERETISQPVQKKRRFEETDEGEAIPLPAQKKKRFKETDERETISLSAYLPAYLVEGIVARMPYPSIYQAQCLSKSWRRKFLPVTSLDSQEERSEVTSFQKMVRELSKDWPAGISPTVLPSLQFLPEKFPTSGQSRCHNGILLSRTGSYNFYAANIFNKSWTKLRRRPNGRRRKEISPILVSEESSNTYKVVVFCKETANVYPYATPAYLQIYDSKSRAWIRKTVLGSESVWSDSAPAYLNGFVYMVQSPRNGHAGSLLKINLEDETFTEQLRLTNAGTYFGTRCYHHLIVCNGELFMIVMVAFSNTLKCILKVNLISGQVLEVSDCAATPYGMFSWQPFSDGHHIFLRSFENLYAYNVSENKWTIPDREVVRESSLRVCFQPGWNPFLAL